MMTPNFGLRCSESYPVYSNTTRIPGVECYPYAWDAEPPTGLAPVAPCERINWNGSDTEHPYGPWADIETGIFVEVTGEEGAMGPIQENFYTLKDPPEFLTLDTCFKDATGFKNVWAYRSWPGRWGFNCLRKTGDDINECQADPSIPLCDTKYRTQQWRARVRYATTRIGESPGYWVYDRTLRHARTVNQYLAEVIDSDSRGDDPRTTAEGEADSLALREATPIPGQADIIQEQWMSIDGDCGKVCIRQLPQSVEGSEIICRTPTEMSAWVNALAGGGFTGSVDVVDGLTVTQTNKVTLSSFEMTDTLIRILINQTSTLKYDYEPEFLGHQDSFTTTTRTLEITNVLLDPVTIGDTITDANRLVDLWDMHDDLLIPWRDASWDNDIRHGPHVSYRNSKGDIAGSPLPIGYAGYFNFYHVRYPDTEESYYGRHFYGKDIYYPHATDSSDYKGYYSSGYPIFLPKTGAFTYVTSGGVLVRKWAEIIDEKPSHNWARPCGDADRATLDQYAGVSCVVGEEVGPTVQRWPGAPDCPAETPGSWNDVASKGDYVLINTTPAGTTCAQYRMVKTGCGPAAVYLDPPSAPIRYKDPGSVYATQVYQWMIDPLHQDPLCSPSGGLASSEEKTASRVGHWEEAVLEKPDGVPTHTYPTTLEECHYPG